MVSFIDDHREAYGVVRGHLLTENRHGLVVDARLTEADGHGEQEAALARLGGVAPGSTVGADRGFDDEAFVLRCRALGITPHNGGADGSKKSSAG